MSVAHICHGWDGVGVGVRGATAFWAWTWVQVSHWQMTSPMALFIPGQKMHPCPSNWALVIPWWNWWSCCSNLSLSKGGTMRASPWRTRPSSMVGVSWCCQYGCKGQGTTYMSSGWPVMMMLVRVAHLRITHKGLLECFLPLVGTGEHGEWQCPVGCQGLDMDWNEKVCQAGSFPYWGGDGWCNHSPGGAVACTAARLACLPGSSGRWIPEACGLIWW